MALHHVSWLTPGERRARHRLDRWERRPETDRVERLADGNTAKGHRGAKASDPRRRQADGGLSQRLLHELSDLLRQELHHLEELLNLVRHDLQHLHHLLKLLLLQVRSLLHVLQLLRHELQLLQQILN